VHHDQAREYLLETKKKNDENEFFFDFRIRFFFIRSLMYELEKHIE